MKKKKFKRPPGAYVFAGGGSVDDLNFDLETHGKIELYVGLNEPSNFNKLTVEALPDDTLVAMYAGRTKWGFFWVTGFAHYRHGRFYPAVITEQMRRLHNERGCLQPEFEPYLCPDYLKKRLSL